MKLKTMYVEMIDNSTDNGPDQPHITNFVVNRVACEVAEKPGEVVSPTPTRTELYNGDSRQDAIAAKNAAERAMHAE